MCLAGCARQGAIPNPDRFPPHLLSISAISSTQLTASFDEEVDSAALLPATYLLTSPSDTPRIKFIARDPNQPGGSNLLLITTPMKGKNYKLSGMVADKEGNASTVGASFKASIRKDTTSPSILVTPREPHTRFPYSIRFQASEPVDTSKDVAVITAPLLRDEKKYSLAWDRDLTTYTLKVSDTTFKHEAFYAGLLPGLGDFSGNRTREGFSGFFYADTGFVLKQVRGKVETSLGKPAGSAILLFTDTEDSIFALTIADTSGMFLTRLKPKEVITLQVFFDENSDYVYEEQAILKLAELEDTIDIITEPVTDPVRLKDIIPPSS